MSKILVINSGSSSFKYQLIDPESGERLASGLVERIGDPVGVVKHRNGDAVLEEELPIPDHTAGFAQMERAFERSGHPLEGSALAAVGHRVVQGGNDFFAPTVIDDRVAARILELGVLAPLHNPAHHQAIVAARATFPDVPHVAVFDTAFHQTMPAAAYTYAIDREVAAEHGIRRYGFHGTSHQYVSARAARFLDRPLGELRQIVLHLGNGASMCAIDGGRSVDTSMGLTPLEGLVMGTRSGDLDPSILFHLNREAEYDVDALDRLLNSRSGLRGLAGTSDFRDVRAAADAGDAEAQLAIDVTTHRIRHYLGAYLATLGGADVVSFTAGVGENNAALRADVCAGLEWFGIRIDPELNAAASGASEPRRISAPDSRVEILVVPTDEEAEIARQTWGLVGAAR
ncbi:acetate/propionate family kinase [Leucobacter chromiireducens]|uniref:Acetate kinase n=1 Tax=Leucobacter chromiireducens subsp. chromiireducens TaxID=660067 RepID=A0ABS1SKN7_9MICO|nr:acetate kinase [Leucobacter chromiireducens subsp. chromiireducens]